MARRSRRGDWITPCDRKLPKGGLLQWLRTVNWFQDSIDWHGMGMMCYCVRMCQRSGCMSQLMCPETTGNAPWAPSHSWAPPWWNLRGAPCDPRSFEDVDHVDPAKAFRKRKASKTNQAWDWPRFCRVFDATVWAFGDLLVLNFWRVQFDRVLLYAFKVSCFVCRNNSWICQFLDFAVLRHLVIISRILQETGSQEQQNQAQRISCLLDPNLHKTAQDITVKLAANRIPSRVC